MKKRKMFFNYQKEERWINEMAADGWHLVDYKFTKYTFEKGEPEKYDYCIELLSDAPMSDKGKEYLEFMKETGIECVALFGNWAYFRKEATGESFEIYTDYDSRKKHLTRIITSLTIVMLMNFFFAIYHTVLMTSDSFSISKYIYILNWLIVIIFTPIIIMYIKNIRDLKRNGQ